jgi:hypothetical protein
LGVQLGVRVIKRFFSGIPHPHLLGVCHLDSLSPWKSAKTVSHRPVDVKWRQCFSPVSIRTFDRYEVFNPVANFVEVMYIYLAQETQREE